jgi:hypothetical protein
MNFYPPCRCKVYAHPPLLGLSTDLCVKQGPTFCLHGELTCIMGPHCDSCYICYPAMPPRDAVPAPVPLPPCIMTLLSLVIAIPLDNPTPAPIDPLRPQCPCTSAYPYIPQRCYRTESPFLLYKWEKIFNWKFNS